MRRFLSLGGAALTLLVACCVASSPASARACALDQRPSMFADGRLPRINKVVPATAAQLASWTFFVFAGSYPARHAIVFRENRRDVARTLSAEAMRQPWGWQFGDGQVAYGRTVRHAYAHAGHWPIKVYVWDPESGRWDLFDQATITVK